jgi:hypothetical protein
MLSEDITPEMLEMERVDPDYFRGAVEAVFTYVNREDYLGRLEARGVGADVSSALISQPGKLIRHVDLEELIPAEFQYGELAFFQKLRRFFFHWKTRRRTLIFVKGIRGCTLSCTQRQRWSKRARGFADSVVAFIRSYAQSSDRLEKILVIE